MFLVSDIYSLFTQTWKRFSSKQRIISIHMRFAKRHCSEISQKVTIISYYVEMPYKKSTWFFSSHSKYCIITAAAALDLYVKSLGNCLEVWTDKWTGYFQAQETISFSSGSPWLVHTNNRKEKRALPSELRAWCNKSPYARISMLCALRHAALLPVSCTPIKTHAPLLV